MIMNHNHVRHTIVVLLNWINQVFQSHARDKNNFKINFSCKKRHFKVFEFWDIAYFSRHISLDKFWYFSWKKIISTLNNTIFHHVQFLMIWRLIKYIYIKIGCKFHSRRKINDFTKILTNFLTKDKSVIL